MEEEIEIEEIEEKGLLVVNLDELASRWQVPIERIMYFVTDCGLDPTCPEDWVPEHWDLFIEEKQKAFEDLLFPWPTRPEFAETSTGS
jgi:hypothetical protein